MATPMERYRAEAKELGLKGYSKLKKAELIALIEGGYNKNAVVKYETKVTAKVEPIPKFKAPYNPLDSEAEREKQESDGEFINLSKEDSIFKKYGVPKDTWAYVVHKGKIDYIFAATHENSIDYEDGIPIGKSVKNKVGHYIGKVDYNKHKEYFDSVRGTEPTVEKSKYFWEKLVEYEDIPYVSAWTKVPRPELAPPAPALQDLETQVRTIRIKRRKPVVKQTIRPLEDMDSYGYLEKMIKGFESID